MRLKYNYFTLFLIFNSCCYSVNAQDSTIVKKNNEVNFNFLQTIFKNSFSFGYERFINSKNALQAEITLNDSHMKGGDKNDKFSLAKSSINLGYSKYFSKKNLIPAGWFLNPYMGYNLNNTLVYYSQQPDNFYSLFIKYYNFPSFGIGGGYVYSNSNLVCRLKLSFQYNLNQSEPQIDSFNLVSSSDFLNLEVRPMIGLGYRF
jgi:hypothetical protein